MPKATNFDALVALAKQVGVPVDELSNLAAKGARAFEETTGVDLSSLAVKGERATRSGVKRTSPTLAVDRAPRQLEMFPGYDKAHRQQRLDKFAAKSVVRKPVVTSRDTKAPDLLPVYHATRGDFNVFETGRPTTNYLGDFFGASNTERHANFFAEDPRFAEEYITDGRTGRISDGGNVMPVYLNATNPFPLDDDGLSQLLDNGPEVNRLLANNIDPWNIYRYFDQANRWELFDDDDGRDFVNNLRGLGYDSAYLKEAHPDGGYANVWAVFDPTQIKSATGNRGSYDPNDPNIRKARGGLAVR